MPGAVAASGRGSRDLLPEPLISVATSAQPGEEREMSTEARVIRTRKDGTRVHLEVARAVFELRGCEFQVVHSRDVSRQWQAERRQRESQGIEAVGQLVGGVAHDFNNLLTGIILYCDLLAGGITRGQPDPPSRAGDAPGGGARGSHGAATARGGAASCQ